MTHRIVAVFCDNANKTEDLLDCYLENSPTCKDPKYDWYSLENGSMYFKALDGEKPDSTGHYRKSQLDFTGTNAAGDPINLHPSAYITPNGCIHEKTNNDKYVDEWENWLDNSEDPYVECADCTFI